MSRKKQAEELAAKVAKMVAGVPSFMVAAEIREVLTVTAALLVDVGGEIDDLKGGVWGE